MGSLGQPTWVSSGGRSLAAWVHRPDDGLSRGAVVIVPSLGHEQVISYRAQRALAVNAARRGWVAVRFSWTGEGDSEGLGTDLDAAAIWSADLGAARQLAAASSGHDEVDAIGFRFGAALAAGSEAPFRSRILWAPTGGRAFLRHHATLRRISLPEEYTIESGGVELCRRYLPAEQAAAIRTIPDPAKLPADGLPSGTCILDSDGDLAEAELFDAEHMQSRVPLGMLTSLLDRLSPGRNRALPMWTPQDLAVVADVDSSVLVQESMVDIGPFRIPGIYASPLGAARPSRAVLLVGDAAWPKAITPWAQLARRLAGRGIPTLRTDRRGIGDAGDVNRVREPNALNETGIADVAEAISWLSRRSDAPVTGIGLCSGGWLLARASARVRLDRAVMINNRAWRTSESRYERWIEDIQSTPVGALAPESPNSSAAGERGPKAAIRAGINGSKGLVPYGARVALARLGIGETPEVVLASTRRSTGLVLVLGDEDYSGFEAMRGLDSEARLRSRGHTIDVIHDPRIDHALISQLGRSALIEVIDRLFTEDAAVVSGGR